MPPKNHDSVAGFCLQISDETIALRRDVDRRQAATYLGLAEYRSGKLTHSLYDGHSSPRAEGAVDEVIAHLESLLYLDSDIEPLKWQGPNGWYYDGAEAGKVLRAEIDALRDGSHWSLNRDGE